MSDIEWSSFDGDDSLFNAENWEPRLDSNPPAHIEDGVQNDEEMKVEDEVDDEDADTEEVQEKSSSSLRMSEPGPNPARYPNLQVTQNMIQPRKLRRMASADVDCFHVLTQIFKKTEYKGKQKEIMHAAVQGADVLVIAPTGMGKSLCFQVPAVADRHGVTLVVSPLLALMKDQVAKLRQLKIPAYAWTSETPQEERDAIVRDLASGHPRCRLLYITPEKLCSVDTMKLITKVHSHGELNRLVIDEAHCISEWGTDFRGEYRKLGTFRDRFKEVPIMALTASATPIVQDDIESSLKLCKDHLFKVVHPFNRPNLFYEIQYLSPSANVLDGVANYILDLHRKRGMPSTGIVYCRTRAGCDEMAGHLRAKGIEAKPYHRGLSKGILETTLREWEAESAGIDVVCATVAFGLGIDKGDVRYVIHADIPKSFEGYYQETGRAGRDTQPAKCILFYSREDAVKVSKLVGGSKGKHDGGPQPKNEFSKQAEKSLTALIKFAESITICRHVSICRFFGEVIDTSDPVVAKAYCDKFCDICKFPDKVKERKAALATDEYISTQREVLERDVGREEDETPLEPPPRLNLPGFRKASDIRPSTSVSKETPATSEFKQDKAPIETKSYSFQLGSKSKKPLTRYDTSKPAPTLKPATGINRAFKIPTFKVPEVPAAVLPPSSPPIPLPSNSSSDKDPSKSFEHGESSPEPEEERIAPVGISSKRVIISPSSSPPSEPSARPIASNSHQISKAPTPSASNNPLGAKPRTVYYPSTGEPKKPKMQEKPSSDGENEDLESIAKMLGAGRNGRNHSPDPEAETEIEAPFSNKISVDLRRKSKSRLRSAITKGLNQDSAEDINSFVWKQLKLRKGDMTEKARINFSSLAAKELEFYVFNLCTTPAGYEIRIEQRLRGIKEAFGEDARAKLAWLDDELVGEDADDEDLDFARDFTELLKRLTGRWRSIKRVV